MNTGGRASNADRSQQSKNMSEETNNRKPEDERRFAAINLLYGTEMFTGTEQACWQYVHERFGASMSALLVDVRAVKQC